MRADGCITAHQVPSQKANFNKLLPTVPAGNLWCRSGFGRVSDIRCQWPPDSCGRATRCSPLTRIRPAGSCWSWSCRCGRIVYWTRVSVFACQHSRPNGGLQTAIKRCCHIFSTCHHPRPYSHVYCLYSTHSILYRSSVEMIGGLSRSRCFCQKAGFAPIGKTLFAGLDDSVLVSHVLCFLWAIPRLYLNKSRNGTL